MLNQVLQEIQAAKGTLRLNEMSARIGVDASALEGMIAFWVSKGKLKPVSMETGASCAAPCAGECPGAAQCPYVATMPRMWETRG